MSKLSELLRAADERHHMTLRQREAKAGTGIQFGTIGKYIRGIHPDSPDEETLNALARAFDLPLAKVQEAAGVPVGAGPWEPPPEVTRLSKRQQRALTELIRSMAEESSDGRRPEAEKTDEQGPERQEGGSDDGQSEDQKSPADGGVTSLHDRRRQKVIDQGLPVEEAADDHPFDLPPDDEDVSQDPDDWER